LSARHTLVGQGRAACRSRSGRSPSRYDGLLAISRDHYDSVVTQPFEVVMMSGEHRKL
jgi:hypothetical protein